MRPQQAGRPDVLSDLLIQPIGPLGHPPSGQDTQLSRSGSRSCRVSGSRRRSIGIEGGDHAADLLDEPEGVRYPPEAVMLIEGGRILVEGINHHESGSDEVGGGDDTPEGVGQEDTAKPLALQTCIDREARKQDRRYFSRTAAADAPGKLVADQAVACQGVVPHHHNFGCMTPDECSGDSARLGPNGVLAQPRVEVWLTRIQAVELVPGRVEGLGSKGHYSG